MNPSRRPTAIGDRIRDVRAALRRRDYAAAATIAAPISAGLEAEDTAADDQRRQEYAARRRKAIVRLASGWHAGTPAAAAAIEQFRITEAELRIARQALPPDIDEAMSVGSRLAAILEADDPEASDRASESAPETAQGGPEQ